ncbi:MAG: hypothetical protein E6593_16175, partial [Clostridium sp.]|nr:hypothetical protein [Clostridium sp.]
LLLSFIFECPPFDVSCSCQTASLFYIKRSFFVLLNAKAFSAPPAQPVVILQRQKNRLVLKLSGF